MQIFLVACQHLQDNGAKTKWTSIVKLLLETVIFYWVRSRLCGAVLNAPFLYVHADKKGLLDKRFLLSGG